MTTLVTNLIMRISHQITDFSPSMAFKTSSLKIILVTVYIDIKKFQQKTSIKVLFSTVTPNE